MNESQLEEKSKEFHRICRNGTIGACTSVVVGGITPFIAGFIAQMIPPDYEGLKMYTFPLLVATSAGIAVGSIMYMHRALQKRAIKYGIRNENFEFLE